MPIDIKVLARQGLILGGSVQNMRILTTGCPSSKENEILERTGEREKLLTILFLLDIDAN